MGGPGNATYLLQDLHALSQPCVATIEQSSNKREQHHHRAADNDEQVDCFVWSTVL